MVGGKGVTALLLGLAIASLSCGIFDTRDSNPPGGNGEGTPRETPINVDAVLFNFLNAVAYKDQGNYEETLAEDFEFVPDPEDRAFFLSTVGSDIFEDWDRGKEMTAVRRIFSESESLTVTLDERDRNEVSTEASVRIDYRFRQRITRSGQEDLIATFKGLAEVHLRADNSSMWSIDRWKETKTTALLTWGRLKGNSTGG